jgi:hypothetical protein
MKVVEHVVEPTDSESWVLRLDYRDMSRGDVGHERIHPPLDLHEVGDLLGEVVLVTHFGFRYYGEPLPLTRTEHGGLSVAELSIDCLPYYQLPVQLAGAQGFGVPELPQDFHDAHRGQGTAVFAPVASMPLVRQQPAQLNLYLGKWWKDKTDCSIYLAGWTAQGMKAQAKQRGNVSRLTDEARALLWKGEGNGVAEVMSKVDWFSRPVVPGQPFAQFPAEQSHAFLAYGSNVRQVERVGIQLDAPSPRTFDSLARSDATFVFAVNGEVQVERRLRDLDLHYRRASFVELDRPLALDRHVPWSVEITRWPAGVDPEGVRAMAYFDGYYARNVL